MEIPSPGAPPHPAGEYGGMSVPGVPGLSARFPGVPFPGLLDRPFSEVSGRVPAPVSFPPFRTAPQVPYAASSDVPFLLPAVFSGLPSVPFSVVPFSAISFSAVPQVPKPRPSRLSRTVIRVSRVSRVTTTRRSPRRMYSAISAHESVMSTHASSAPASRSILRPSAAGARRMPFAPRLRASRMSVARSPTT